MSTPRLCVATCFLPAVRNLSPKKRLSLVWSEAGRELTRFPLRFWVKLWGESGTAESKDEISLYHLRISKQVTVIDVLFPLIG